MEFGQLFNHKKLSVVAPITFLSDDGLNCFLVNRIMGPVDTQMYGNVHGGVVMELIEEAGSILTMQYCNTNGNTSKV